MERLSDTAITIINELHTERLDYQSEYLPLIDAANKLAAYETSGLEPEEVAAIEAVLIGRKIAEIKEINGVPIKRLNELAQAEKDGCLVVLPCKVGDTVYRVAKRKKYINNPKNTMYIKEIVIKPENVHKYINEVGRTVYLTREEAEAVLKGAHDAES